MKYITVNGARMTLAKFSRSTGLSVSGSLYLIGCTGLTTLPDGLSVGGSLNLFGCTSLTTLPDGLSVGGSLNLFGCTGLTTLPDGLSVGGSLDLSGCTGLTNIGRGGADGRGYEFFAARLASGVRVLAGCRNLSPSEAKRHWSGRLEQLALARAALASLQNLGSAP